MSRSEPIERKSLSVAEFAAAHGLCRATVYKLIGDNKIPAFRLGHSLRIPANAGPTGGKR